MKTTTTRRWAMGAALGAAAVLLAACAGLATIAADVTSFGAWPAANKPGSYAFDRLPSQQSDAAQTQAIEVSAAAALSKAGFSAVAAGQQPEYLIQVGASDGRLIIAPWDDPFWWRGGFGYWGYGPWMGPRWGLGWRYDYMPRFERQVGLLIRERASGKPLYEVRATSEGNRSMNGPLMTAMFDAALTGFPNPPSKNPHRVEVVVQP
ncbi:MAG: DUF4136 domain-containing protein [Burkholderiales bacterium]|nr:DUF4136 domain-containing protein [Burkholderiales bacterium]